MAKTKTAKADGDGLLAAHGTSPVSARAEALVKTETLSASRLAQQADRMAVETAEEYELATGFLRDVKGRIKVLKDEQVAMTGPLTAVVKRIAGLFRRPLDLLEHARDACDGKLGEYRAEARRRQADEQARLDEAAAKETDRLRRLADRKATRLEAKGRLAEAAEVRAVPPTVVAEEAAPADIPMVAGTWTRTVWKCRVVDLDLLVMARAAGTVPKEAVIANEPFLNKVAEDQRGTMRWPGVEVYPEETTVTGRA